MKTMQRRRLPSRRGWLLLAMFTSLLLGCDNFDLSTLLPPKSNGPPADGRAEVRATQTSGALAAVDFEKLDSAARDAGTRDPDMQSIGPDASMRIYYQFVDNRGRVQLSNA